MIAFGPVPSRRLGRSLGVNNIPPKICTYSCVYCQLGRTIKMQVERQPFYEPEQVAQVVGEKVAQARAAGEPVDYLTFVPDGEPTLDVNLGREIESLRPLGVKIAVITNSSLVWHADVRAALAQSDWVSVKVDATREEVWRRVDRPHGALKLRAILDGLLEFASVYTGKLVTETMLVAGVNDDDALLSETANFVGRLQPAVAYLSIPTRPPAEEWVRPPDEGTIVRAHQIFSGSAAQVEYLIGYEGNEFAFTGNVEEDLLSITSVHPMREEAVDEFLARAGADWPVVREMVARGQLVEAEYDGFKFYTRKLR